MPGIPHSRFHLMVRAPAADALDRLAEHTEDVLAAWHSGIRPLGLNPSAFLSASSIDFSMLADELRRSTYAVFRRRVKEFGKALAQRASLGQAVVAFNELYGICIRVLLEDETRKASPVLALSRLYALAGLVVVSGYTGEWSSGRETLVEASILEAEDEARAASAYVMRIYEQELHRIAQELRDDVVPDLVRIEQYLEIARAAQGKELPELYPRLAEAGALLSGSIESLRRIGLDLGRAMFEDLGFLSAVRAYAQQFSARTKISVVVREGHIPETIPMTHQVTLYRLIQGALANVLDGASAKNVNVSLGCVKDSVLVMVIEDDGAVLCTKNRPARPPFGLRVMRERAESLGGRIHIESRRESPKSPERGTRIQIDLPLPGRPLALSSSALSSA